MKQAILLFSFVTLITACSTSEFGATENETLSRKLFDTLRKNDFDKSSGLLPDKGTFRKIEAERGNKLVNVDSAYAAFLAIAETNFNQTFAAFNEWDLSKFERATTEPIAGVKIPTEQVTSKFVVSGLPYKITFTSIKFNNRWYCYGDLAWVPRTP